MTQSAGSAKIPTVLPTLVASVGEGGLLALFGVAGRVNRRGLLRFIALGLGIDCPGMVARNQIRITDGAGATIEIEPVELSFSKST